MTYKNLQFVFGTNYHALALRPKTNITVASCSLSATNISDVHMSKIIPSHQINK